MKRRTGAILTPLRRRGGFSSLNKGKEFLSGSLAQKIVAGKAFNENSGAFIGCLFPDVVSDTSGAFAGCLGPDVVSEIRECLANPLADKLP